MQKSIFTPDAPAPRGFYSQAIQAGPFLYIAGQLPLDPQGNMVGGPVAAQATQALRNIEAILLAAGGTLANLVQVTIYITDIAHWPEVNTVYESLLASVPVPPARAVVPVNPRHYDALIEIQATAFFDKSEG